MSWMITLSLIVFIASSNSVDRNNMFWLHQDNQSSSISVNQFLNESRSVEFMKEHGVFMTVASPRASPLPDTAVNQLAAHIKHHQLVDGYEGTLFVGIINQGYFDMAMNFICFIERLHMTNWLVGASDDESFQQMHLLGYGKHVISLPSLFNDSALSGCKNPASFREACFNKQTQMKSQLVLATLLAGYTAILTDMDILFMHNPLLYMPLTHDWEMVLEPQEWCTGFYVNKPTALNIAMQTQVIAGMINFPKFDDQKIYNEWIRYHRFVVKETIDNQLFALDMQLFPNGKNFGNFSAVIQHNNWILGTMAKMQRTARWGLWLYDQTHSDEAIQQYLLTSNSTGKSDVKHLYQPNKLLQCTVCEVCGNYVPAVPKLRDTFPGPLLTSNFEPYRGVLTSDHA